MIRLQERAHALFQAPDATFGSQIRFFVRWLQGEPFFATTLEALPQPLIGAAEWLQEHVQWGQGLTLSDDEAAAVGELWLVIRHMAAQPDPDDATFRIVANFLQGTGNKTSDFNRAFLEIFVDPVIAFLKEKILKDDLVLHSVERYAREAGWFRRDELRDAYMTDTTRGEATLDLDLRWHLFRDGIDFPFSQTHIPSGRPDIVVPDDEAEPLPLEVKVFDPDNGRDKNGSAPGSRRRSSTPTTIAALMATWWSSTFPSRGWRFPAMMRLSTSHLSARAASPCSSLLFRSGPRKPQVVAAARSESPWTASFLCRHRGQAGTPASHEVTGHSHD
jgi:hypothetical protein